MKNFIISAIMLLSVTAVQAAPILIDEIQVGIVTEQILGANANYDASEHRSTWSEGVAGWILTDTGDFYFFDSALDIDVVTTINGAVDTTSGQFASAVFNSANWSISLSHPNYGSVASISGHLFGNYNEFETATDHLEGHAVVTIDNVSFNNTYWGLVLEGGSVVWNGGDKAGIIADIALPNGTNFVDYSQDYSTTNMILTLYADETQIPEPATITMLALGALSLIRRK